MNNNNNNNTANYNNRCCIDYIDAYRCDLESFQKYDEQTIDDDDEFLVDLF